MSEERAGDSIVSGLFILWEILSGYRADVSVRWFLIQRVARAYGTHPLITGDCVRSVLLDHFVIGAKDEKRGRPLSDEE